MSCAGRLYYHVTDSYKQSSDSLQKVNSITKIRRVLGKNTLSWGKVFLNKQKKKPESHGFTSEKWKTQEAMVNKDKR